MDGKKYHKKYKNGEMINPVDLMFNGDVHHIDKIMYGRFWRIIKPLKGMMAHVQRKYVDVRHTIKR